jgi:nitrite reductase (NO-forming)
MKIPINLYNSLGMALIALLMMAACSPPPTKVSDLAKMQVSRTVQTEQGSPSQELTGVQELPGDEHGDKGAATANKSLARKIASGKQIYVNNCLACHQASGEGIANAFPPLSNSDYLNADVDRAIGILLHGLRGEITVNGNKYNSIMTRQHLSNEEVADVLTYVYNSWDNNKTDVSAARVEAVRSKH